MSERNSEIQVASNLMLSSEERLQIENMCMGEGLSDSSSSNIQLNKSFGGLRAKKCRRGPGVPKNRDGLGNYVPPTGGKPLSRLAEPSPGPSDYQPSDQVTKKKFPVYTLGFYSQPLYTKKSATVPGPKYDVRGDMKWGKRRRMTIKLPDTAKTYTLGPGPGATKLLPLTTGPKYTMGKRYRKPTFFHSPLVMPINPDAPGPNCIPPSTLSDRAPSIGSGRRDRQTPQAPGPQTYRLKDVKTGPSYPIAGVKDREPKTYTAGPGPGKYQVQTTMGKGPRAPLGRRHVQPDYKAYIPGPDIYHRAGFRLDEPGVTMKYRWMDSDPVTTPGPGHYNVEKLPQMKPPAFTIKHRVTEPKFRTPGPGEYDLNLTAWNTSGRSFGTKNEPYPRTSPDDSSGYVPADAANKVLPSAPSYSMARSHSSKVPVPTPGPCTYSPKPPKGKNSVSIGNRIPISAKTSGPGPALPLPKPGDFLRGCIPEPPRSATLKSRHTPLKYTGMKNSNLIRDAPLEVRCAPLIG